MIVKGHLQEYNCESNKKIYIEIIKVSRMKLYGEIRHKINTIDARYAELNINKKIYIYFL